MTTSPRQRAILTLRHVVRKLGQHYVAEAQAEEEGRARGREWRRRRGQLEQAWAHAVVQVLTVTDGRRDRMRPGRLLHWSGENDRKIPRSSLHLSGESERDPG